MKKAFLVRVYEWDCLNGDMLFSEHYIVYARDNQELKEKCNKLLEGYLNTVNDEWEEIAETEHSAIFSKCEEEDEYENEVGYEIVAEINSKEELETVRKFWTIVGEIK